MDDEFADVKRQIQSALIKRNQDSLTAVTYAAREGDVEGVRTLLKLGLPIDSADYDGRRALPLPPYASAPPPASAFPSACAAGRSA